MLLKFKQIANEYRENRFKTAFKYVSLVLCLIDILTLPLFTYRSGFNSITNALSLAFSIVAIFYLAFWGKFYLEPFTLFYLSFCLLSLVSSIVTQRGFSVARTTLFVYFFALLVYQFARNCSFGTPIFYSFIISGIVIGTVIIISNFESIISLDVDRLGSEFGNVNSIGLVFAICFIFSLYKTLFIRVKALTFVFLILSVFFAFLSFLTGSRAAVLVLLMSFLAAIFLKINNKKKVLFPFIVLFVCIVFALILQLPIFSSFKKRVIDAFISLFSGGASGNVSSDSRLSMIKEGINLWFTSPFFGHGIDSFKHLSGFRAYAHSSLANLISSFGILGFSIFIGPSIYLCLGFKNNDARKLPIIFFIGLLIPGLFVYVLETSKFFVIGQAIIISYTSCSFEFKRSYMDFSLHRRPRLVSDRFLIR